MVTAALGQLGPRKHPFGYWFASFIFPGLGTMFAGRVLKGILLLVIAAADAIGIGVLGNEAYRQTTPADALGRAFGGPGARVCNAGCNAQGEALIALGLAVLFLGLWIYGMTDAVSAVHRWNRAHGYTH